MKDDRDELKTIARLARNRMKNGFWTRVKAQRENLTDEEARDYASYVKRELEREKRPDEKELAFYRKVEELVNSGGEVTNPIGRLIEQDYYETLDYAAKQRYILELSEKYLQVAATIAKK